MITHEQVADLQPGMSAVLSRHDNVVEANFSGPASPPPEAEPESSTWWPWAEGPDVDAALGKPSTATRPLPARWSPRPVRVARRRFARSQLARDLRRYVWLLWFLGCLLVGLWISARVHPVLITTPTGGTP